MRIKRFITMGVLSICMTQMSACGKGNVDASALSETQFEGTYIITAQEAVDKIGDENVQFLDARGSTRVLLGTVDGAVVTRWKELSTCETGNAGDAHWGLVPEAEDLEVRLGNLGLDKEKQIIVLGEPQEGWGEDGRILWELLQAGFENVKLVDGGIVAMKNAGAKMQLGGDTPKKTKVSIDELDTSNNITTEELQENYDSFKIVDVRTVEEYEGAILHDEAKGGHLPGAYNVPFVDMLTSEGHLKSNAEISEMLEACGIEREDDIVVYCTGGIRSAYAQLILEMCGYTNTRNYGQSFWRWAVVGEVE